MKKIIKILNQKIKTKDILTQDIEHLKILLLSILNYEIYQDLFTSISLQLCLDIDLFFRTYQLY